MKVTQSIKKLAEILAVGMEIGSYLCESERVLNKHLELSKQTKVRKPFNNVKCF